MSTANPFLDPTMVHGGLYADPGRLAQRTDALHRAKIAGRYAADVTADLAAASPLPPRPVIADIGCGRGSTTAKLAERCSSAALIAVDASPAMLTATHVRLGALGERVWLVCGDFHRLPLPSATCHLAVAAFCLYHSPRPEVVVAEIRRCLAPGATAILATKSADSYREFDELLARSRIDPCATARPSLYETAHSANLPALVGQMLDVRQVVHEQHRFRFANLGHLAEYLVTTPKYVLRDGLRNDARALAAELGKKLPDTPVYATSTVTYIVAQRPGQ